MHAYNFQFLCHTTEKLHSERYNSLDNCYRRTQRDILFKGNTERNIEKFDEDNVTCPEKKIVFESIQRVL